MLRKDNLKKNHWGLLAGCGHILTANTRTQRPLTKSPGQGSGCQQPVPALDSGPVGEVCTHGLGSLVPVSPWALLRSRWIQEQTSQDPVLGPGVRCITQQTFNKKKEDVLYGIVTHTMICIRNI